MKRTRRMEITLETDELLVIRSTAAGPVACCLACGDGVPLVSIDEAVAVSSLAARAIFHLIESGSVHHAETDDGFLMVCLRSLGRTRVSRTPPQHVSSTHRRLPE